MDHMTNPTLGKFVSKCGKHHILVTRMCVSHWTPNGTSVRVEDGSKTCFVLPQNMSDEQCVECVWDHAIQPLIDKGIEFGN